MHSLLLYFKDVIILRINEAINSTKNNRPTLAGNSLFLLWISTLDGRVLTDIFGEDTRDFSYTAHDIEKNTQLLIPSPFDICYIHYLSAMTDIANGDFAKYQNDFVLFNQSFEDFAKYTKRKNKGKVYKFFGW